jgi:hypothetical protein
MDSSFLLRVKEAGLTNYPEAEIGHFNANVKAIEASMQRLRVGHLQTLEPITVVSYPEQSK